MTDLHPLRIVRAGDISVYVPQWAVDWAEDEAKRGDAKARAWLERVVPEPVQVGDDTGARCHREWERSRG